MNICYVYQDQFPWDIRVDKFLEVFNDAGFTTNVVSRNRTGLPILEGYLEHVFIHRLSQGFGKVSKWFVNFPAFFSPFWLGKIVRVASTSRAQVIIVRDLPMSPSAIFAGKILKIPVFIDMAENYPAMLEDTWKFRGPKLMDYLIRNPVVFRRLEKWVVGHVDGIIVVSDESRNRVLSLLRENGGLPIWIIENTPRLQRTAGGMQHPIIEGFRKKSGLRLLYVGGMEPSRGLDTVLKAISHLKKRNFPIHFIIVGEGESREALMAQSRILGVEGDVEFTGYIDQKHIPSIINSCDVCIIPHYVSEHTDTTIPNKIYDYMAQGKAIVSTQAKTLRRIVEETNCGYTYKDKDEIELAECLLKLSDSGKRIELGGNGQQSVLRRFNWDWDKQILLGAMCHAKEYQLRTRGRVL